MRAALFAVLAFIIPAEVLACRAPPHMSDSFRSKSFAALPGCDGQWQQTCEVNGISAAWYQDPTDIYQHGVLGDGIEAQSLSVYTDSAGQNSCGAKQLRLDASHVFEDIAPRLVDLDGDGRAEVITVRSHLHKGAQLAIWQDVPGETGLRLLATTPYIGRAHRWLAPVGAADLDGDGHVEIAFIDRPHLAKTLRIWRFRNGRLTDVAQRAGLTNHRIGWDHIPGGLRLCGGRRELVTANADWTRIIASTLQGGEIRTRDIGKYTTPARLNAALRCP